MSIEARLAELGITLPQPAAPVATSNAAALAALAAEAAAPCPYNTAVFALALDALAPRS